MDELEKLTKQVETLTASLTKVQEDLKKSDDALQLITAEKASVQFIASLSDVEKAHYEGLDDEGKTAFTKLSADKRAETLRKKADSDETIEYEGQTIRKSVVGDGSFVFMKSMLARADASEARAEKSANEALLSTMTKRGAAEFANLPLTDDEKGTMLKAISTLAKADRDLIEKALKAGNAAMQKHFDPTGGNGADGSAGEQLDGLVKAYMVDNKVDESVAFDKVLKTEKGADLYAQANQ